MPTRNPQPTTPARTAGRHGGRRPGAGAPKGNLNGLKTGKRSKQLKTLIIALVAHPDTRRILLDLARRGPKGQAELRDAIVYYARLLALPSRQRSIDSVTQETDSKKPKTAKTENAQTSNQAPRESAAPIGPSPQRRPINANAIRRIRKTPETATSPKPNI